jgi:hypothetical protein
MVNFSRKPGQVKCLYLDNGILQVKKVLDVGDILLYQRGPKWLGWAKGRPILSKVRGLKGSTWLLCPEVAWTLDETGMNDVMKAGKSHLLDRLLDRLVELGEESDGLKTMKAQKDRVMQLQSELDQKAKQLSQAQEAAAKESADRISAEAKLQSESEARQRAELIAEQERERREALQLSRGPAGPNQSKGGTGPHGSKGGASKKQVKGAEKIT